MATSHTPAEGTDTETQEKSVRTRTSEIELQHRNRGAGSVLSNIAMFQEIGCSVDVSINGETRVRIKRGGIRYTVRQIVGSPNRPERFAIGMELNGDMDIQGRKAAYASFEDAMHTLYDCIVRDPRQDGIEVRGLRHTDTR